MAVVQRQEKKKVKIKSNKKKLRRGKRKEKILALGVGHPRKSFLKGTGTTEARPQRSKSAFREMGESREI